MIQGYGLTETAPIVTLSHPFHHIQEGTVGKPLGGVEVKIAEDGEILVRGENVSQGYFQSPQETSTVIRDGWLHTGDIGELDKDGNLTIRGRKKEMIVTPEGLKVFPEDVEKVLNQMEGVRESAVIGKDRVHAVLVLEPGVDADRIVREANQRLEEHQKIRSVSVWTGGELPRTHTTRKLRRAEIADAVWKGKSESGAKPENELAGLLQKYAPDRTITPDTTLDELGLSSLDRVQLMMDLEQKLDTEVDEHVFSSMHTVGDLGRPGPPPEPIHFPTYNRTGIAKPDSPRLAALLSASPDQNLRSHQSLGTRSSRGSTWPGCVCFQSSELSRCSGDPGCAAGALALSGCAGDVQGIFRRPLLPAAAYPARAFHEQPELPSVDAVFQCFPDPAAGIWSRTIHPLYG